MRKRIDYRRVGRQILIFLFILALGLLNLKAQVVYSEDFSTVPNGSNASPRWEVNTANATPDMFWVMAHQFECRYLRGEAVWYSSLIDISGFDKVHASVSLTERGQMDADDFIRVYYNIDGRGEVLFSENGNKEGPFGTVWARQHNISGRDLQLSIHVKNDQYNERYSFDNIQVEGHAETYTWLGTEDSAWSNPANWSSGFVPDMDDEAVISAAAPFKPVISGIAGCRSLSIEKNAALSMLTGATLTITGDFKCVGTFHPGKGMVRFAGEQPQMVESESKLSFYNLEIANHSAEGVTCGKQIQVRNHLTLTDGILIAEDTVTMLNAAPDAVTAWSDSAYVAGKLQRRIHNKGEGSYDFPVGEGTKYNYHPARIDVNSLEGTSAITVSFEQHDKYIPSYLTATGSDFIYEYYVPEGMWVITPDAEPAGGWYDLRLSVQNIEGLIDNRFGILKRPRGAAVQAWTSQFGSESVFGGEGRKIADGYALKKYCTGFSEFTLGGAGIAIPIELLEFNAQLVQGKVNINWSTATEIENAYFTIEKSNGTDFKEVAKVNSQGNSSTQQNYAATDEKPFTGVSYYRLKQTDQDGKVEYSDVVSVKNVSDNQFIIFPNPADGSVKMKFNTALPKLEVVVYNQHGTISYNKTIVSPTASSVIELQLKEELAPGIYYIQVTSEGEDMMIQQIVIQ